MFEITHNCKELKFANSINHGDIIIHYGNWGDNEFKEWLMRNEELDNGEYADDQTIDTMGIKFCPYCGELLVEPELHKKNSLDDMIKNSLTNQEILKKEYDCEYKGFEE